MKIIFIIISFCLGGCASITEQLGFNEVKDSIFSRTKNEVYWNQGTPADEAVKLKIDNLLGSELTPESSVQIALFNNKGIQAVYESLNIAQSDLVEAGLLRNPILNGEMRFPKEGGNFELSLVQDFISILQIPLRKRVAKAKFEEVKLEVIENILELAASTKISFYEYQAAEQNLEIAKTSLQALEASANFAQNLHDAGNITDLELAQEKSSYEDLKIKTSIYELEVIEKREELNSKLGLWQEPNKWHIEKRLPEIEESEFENSEVEKEALTNSLELAKARKGILLLAETLSLTKDFRIFSSNDLGISAAKEGEGTWGFGPAFNISIPLFNQGQPAIFRANAELNRKYLEYQNLAVSIRAKLRSVMGRQRIAFNRTKYYREILMPLKATVVSESQKQYNGMLIGIFQLLRARNDQIVTAQEYVDTLKEFWILNTELESMVNGKTLMAVEISNHSMTSDNFKEKDNQENVRGTKR